MLLCFVPAKACKLATPLPHAIPHAPSVGYLKTCVPGQEQDKACRNETLGTMNRIMVCAELALKPKHLGSEQELDLEKKESFPLPQLPDDLGLQDCHQSFAATLIGYQLSQQAQKPSDYIQFGIWYVHGMGYVAAFKGTTKDDLVEWLTNVNVAATPVVGSPDISVHKGFAHAISTRSMILKTICADWPRRQSTHTGELPHLLITGQRLCCRPDLSGLLKNLSWNTADGDYRRLIACRSLPWWCVCHHLAAAPACQSTKGCAVGWCSHLWGPPRHPRLKARDCSTHCRLDETPSPLQVRNERRAFCTSHVG